METSADGEAQTQKPNISNAVLEQARQGTAEQGGATESREQEAAPAKSAAPAAAPKPRRRRALQAAQLERRKDEGALDAEFVAERLANPTKVVSEEDLRADYGFVIKTCETWAFWRLCYSSP